MTTELNPDEWDAMLAKEKAGSDPNSALSSPLGLDEEAKNNLTFMVVTLGGFILAGLFGGWLYLTS